MDESSTPRPASMRSRIQDLRRRIVSLQAATGQESLVPLDHRVARLSELIARETWNFGAESAQAVNDVISLDAPHAYNPPSSDDARRADALIGQLRPLQARLDEVARSTALHHRPVERTRVERARQIADLTIRMVEEARSKPRHQVLLLPVWDAMLRQVNETFADVARLVSWTQRRHQQVSALREFFCQLDAGNKPRLQAVMELAARVVEDVDDEPYPDLLPPTLFEPMHILAVHADNVAHIVAFLASLDAVWRSHRHSLVIAAFFMDAGMMRCALDVLGSSQPLTPEQRTRVERHPHESAALAERVQGLDESLVEAVRMHHERLDGTGYPSGCRGDDIRVPARLLAAADVYIACRSYRPHRPALSPKDALTTALSQAEAGQLDALRVRGLLNLSLYPVGTIVELSTAEIAEVIAPQNAQLDPTLAGQPIVRLLVDRRGQPVALPLYRNLAIRPDCRITRVISVEEAAARRAAI